MTSYYHNNMGLSYVLKKLYRLPMNVTENNLGLPLDISRIESDLIVCSCPVVSTHRLLFRNKLDDLITYLNISYGLGNWKLYNLKIEVTDADYTDRDLLKTLQFPSGILVTKNAFCKRFLTMQYAPKYKIIGPLEPQQVFNDSSQLKAILLRKGWLDHYPPPFKVLQEVIDDMNQFLKSNDNHKCVVHCKMGKGRSGTVCVAYLMKYRKMSLANAMERFTENRFKSQMLTPGVTIKSQIRYLNYHKHYLSFNNNNQKLLMDVLKDDYTFIVSSILVRNPSKMFTSRMFTCWLNFKKYNPRRDGVITLERLDLTKHVCDFITTPHIETDANNYEIEHKILSLHKGKLKFPLYLNANDIMLEFEITINQKPVLLDSSSFYNDKDNGNITSNNLNSFSKTTKRFRTMYIWINVLFEFLNSRGSMDETFRIPSKPDEDLKVEFNWDEIDTIAGSKRMGLHLFESIEFIFEMGDH